MSGSTGSGGNSIGGGSQFGNMGKNDPYGNGNDQRGESRGNGGGRDDSRSHSSATTSPEQQQISAIQNDPVIRQKLSGILLAALSINSAAKLRIERISPTGTMSLSVTGINADQAKELGLGGLVMGIQGADNIPLALGDIETGHKVSRPGNNPGGGTDATQAKNSLAGRYLAVLQGELPAGYWLDNGKVMIKVREERTSGGGGKGNERTRIVEINREVPLLTAAFNEGAKIRNEAAEEARRRQDEWDANNPVGVAERNLKKASEDLKKAEQSIDFAKKIVIDKQSELVAVQDKITQIQRALSNIGGFNPNNPQALSYMGELNKSKQRYAALPGEIDKAQKDVISAVEARKNREKEKKDAESQLTEIRDKENDEKETLLKASELISSMGDKIGEHLGDKYKGIAKEIAENVRGFQGRTLRTYEQSMSSLNEILANPAMKINKGDKDALINAWESFKADDTAKKLGNLSRAFKAADIALKAEKVREKSIHGYETGDWGPLMLEVESWVLSGVAAGVAIGLFGAILSMLPVSGLALTALTIAGIIAIGYLSSKIDDKIADKINNEVIRLAN